MKRRHLFVLTLALLTGGFHALAQKKPSPANNGRGGFDYFVGVVGNPAVTSDIDWSDEALKMLKDLGVNMLQLSVAWGGKPANEVINLEDLDDPEQMTKWKYRVAQAEKNGFKTIAHFGIPRMLNADPVKPACISDPAVQQEYVRRVKKFMSDFPEVNDMLVYTFDQQAWICSEFGHCPLCSGIPLNERLSSFLSLLKEAMAETRPDGKAMLWWKPWELSKGQTIEIIKGISGGNFGLVLNGSTHNEVYPFNDGALKSDLGVKRMVQYAYERGIPVIGDFMYTLYNGLYQIDDYFPRLVYEHMNGWKELAGVVGVKEYYGFAPSRYSVNFSMLKAWMKNPNASLNELLQQIAAPYGVQSAPFMIKAWEYVAQAVEAFPWDVTKIVGPILNKKVSNEHSWDYVKIINGTWDTPIWESNRRANYMLTDAKTAHPWIFEDMGIRLRDAAELKRTAVEYFDKAIVMNEKLTDDIRKQRDFIDNAAHTYEGMGIHYLLTLAAHNARTVQYDRGQFEKVCGQIRLLLQDDIKNGYKMAEKKLAEFDSNPKEWLKQNFHPLTWRSEAAPNWDKWIAP